MKRFILRPGGQGILADWHASEGENWQCLLGEESRGRFISSRSNATDLYRFRIPPDFPTRGSILRVAICSIAWGYNSRFNHALFGGVVQEEDGPIVAYNLRAEEHRLLAGPALFSNAWTINPWTGVAWRFCEIARLQAGPSMVRGVGRCSAGPLVTRFVNECYLEVEVEETVTLPVVEDEDGR